MKKECKRLLYDSPRLKIFALHSGAIISTSYHGTNAGDYDEGDWSGSGSGAGGYEDENW